MESIFDILYIPMGYILRFAYSLTNNYLLAICLFTLVMEILCLPFAIKQQKNQIKQASLAPQVNAIRKKYAGRNDQATQQKMQQETMDLYQKNNFNPASGCGTLLIQFPIIICLYNVVTQPLRYICNVPTAQIKALQGYLTDDMGIELNLRNLQLDIINHIRGNVSEYYHIADKLEGAVIPDFNVGPFDLSQVPEISFSPFNWLMLIPIITFVVQILSMKIMRKFTYQDPSTKDAQNAMSMKIMEWSMPLMFVWIEFQMAAAIGVYWIFRNVISTAEKIIIAKIMPTPKFTEEDFREAERQANLSEKQKKREKKEQSGDRKFVRSLHHIDDEEYLERHAEDLKALEDGKTVKASEVGETTGADSKKAPAPIKNDDKTSYKEKKD